MTVQHCAEPATCTSDISASQNWRQRSERLREQQRSTCTASLDPELRIVAADANFFHTFGRASTDTCGRNLYDLLHPSAPNLLGRHFTRLAEGRRTRFAERILGIGPSHGIFSGELTGIAVQTHTDQPLGYVITIKPDHTTSTEEDPSYHNKPTLSQIDAQILEGIAGGASTIQLASRLYLSRQGVEYHVGLMLRRLKATNRAALVARAHSLGILTVGTWPPRVLPEFVK